MLGGKLEDATRFYFNLYDIDNDGTVTREEVMNLFMSSKIGAENARENATDLLRVGAAAPAHRVPRLAHMVRAYHSHRTCTHTLLPRVPPAAGR